MAVRERPLGVTILGIVTILGSLLSAIGGLLSIFVLDLFGPIFAIVSLVGVVVGFGLLGLRLWAWNVAVFYFCAQIVLSFLSGGPLALLPLVLLVYLFVVREEFR
jgi:hypothetical protein